MAVKKSKQRKAAQPKTAKRKATKRKTANVKKVAKRKQARGRATNGPRCGLCGATTNLIRTECCGEWICDDYDQYELFSYAHNSCNRNHDRYTLCGHHFTEGHDGDWMDCEKCRKNIEPEMYVYFGTNDYNFQVLENPPEFEPTKCSQCGAVIELAEGGYSMNAKGYRCGECTYSK